MLEGRLREIAKRAYDLWLARGVIQGHDVDDWLNAECELRQVRHGQRHGGGLTLPLEAQA